MKRIVNSAVFLELIMWFCVSDGQVALSTCLCVCVCMCAVCMMPRNCPVISLLTPAVFTHTLNDLLHHHVDV